MATEPEFLPMWGIIICSFVFSLVQMDMMSRPTQILPIYYALGVSKDIPHVCLEAKAGSA